MADRYLYIACIGVWFPFVYYLFRIFSKIHNWISLSILITTCSIFLVLTFFRNSIWLNQINFWNAIVDKFPESGVAQYSLGAAYAKEGVLDSAELHLNNAVQFDPKNYKAWSNKGMINARQGKAKAALAAFDNCLKLYPYTKATFARGMLYHNMRKYVLAMEDLNKVIDQQSSNARAYFLRADCQEQLGNPGKALKDYNKAIIYDDHEPLFLIRRGLLLSKNGNKKSAFTDLDKAVVLNPLNGEALYYRALIRYSLGQNPCDDLRQSFLNGYKRADKMLKKICK